MTIDWHAAKKESGGIGKEFDRPIDDHNDITIVVDELPYDAGFDPYNKLIDRVSSDNRKRVDIEGLVENAPLDLPFAAHRAGADR